MNDLEKVLEAQNATVIAAKEEHEALRQSSLTIALARGGSGNASHLKAIELALGNVYSADELRELLEVALCAWRLMCGETRATGRVGKQSPNPMELRDKRMEELKAFSTRSRRQERSP